MNVRHAFKIKAFFCQIDIFKSAASHVTWFCNLRTVGPLNLYFSLLVDFPEVVSKLVIMNGPSIKGMERCMTLTQLLKSSFMYYIQVCFTMMEIIVIIFALLVSSSQVALMPLIDYTLDTDGRFHYFDSNEL